MIYSKTELAKLTDLDVSIISRVLNRNRKPSLEAARRLEKATGIPRIVWLYPDEYDNPYMRKNSD